MEDSREKTLFIEQSRRMKERSRVYYLGLKMIKFILSLFSDDRN